LGIHEDATYRNKLVPLLRYETSNSNGDLISFDDYIENMKPNQSCIYYITAESVKSIINSPFLEKLRSKDYEVIYMCDPLDEYITQQVRDYKDKKLVCVTKENTEIDNNESEKEELERSKVEFKNVCDYMKSTLSDDVEKVVVSNKLSNSPCVLSTSEFGWTANMQRILKAQTFNKPEMNFMMGRKVLEINPNNRIIQKIKYRLDNEQMDSYLSDLVVLLYEVTLQASGFTVDNPSRFSNNVLKLIDNGLNNNNPTFNNDLTI
jgi:molecular chaperone HtpG